MTTVVSVPDKVTDEATLGSRSSSLQVIGQSAPRAFLEEVEER